jgi:hypothetical protein
LHKDEVRQEDVRLFFPVINNMRDVTARRVDPWRQELVSLYTVIGNIVASRIGWLNY